MTNAVEQAPVSNTTGIVLHRAFLYDLLHRLRGGERAFRDKTLEMAGLRAGEWVLDVGCGTGTLAIAAICRVGPSGKVYGIDASPEMIARAHKKAKKSAADVTFENATVEKLPFSDGSFDAVLSTVMLHHLGRQARQQCFGEIRRVLRPGGRLLAVDFGDSGQNRRSFLAHFHRHGCVKFTDLARMLNEAGFATVETGPLGTRNLHYASARVPCCA